jgi:uncharacterized protein (TIGR03067 family)
VATNLLAALALSLVLGADGKDPVDSDRQKLEGKWTITSAVMDGNKVPKGQLKGFVIFKGKHYSYRTNGEKGEGTFKIDPTKNPKFLDSIPSDGPVKGMTVEQIYEVDGENLKICLTLPGNDRPTEFKSEPGSNRMLFTYKRAK